MPAGASSSDATFDHFLAREFSHLKQIVLAKHQGELENASRKLTANNAGCVKAPTQGATTSSGLSPKISPRGSISSLGDRDGDDVEEVSPPWRQISACTPLSESKSPTEDNTEVLCISNPPGEEEIKCLRSHELMSDASKRSSPASPAHWELLNVWVQDGKHRLTKSPTVERVRQHPSITIAGKMNGASRSTHIMAQCVANPNSNKRLFWNVLRMSVIAWDAFAVPFDICGFPETWFTSSMTWLTRVFWTLDMVVSFFTGYVCPDGNVEMRLARIAKHYAKTWLIPDSIIVIVDWLYVFISAASAIQSGRFVRILRILRMTRLLRMARAIEAFEAKLSSVLSEKLNIVTSLSKCITIIVCLVHLIACVWYAIGDSDGGWASNWPGDRWWRYSLALHWSLSRFTGTSDVYPTTVGERFFAIFCGFFAFVVATWFVSDITSSMTRLHMRTIKTGNQFSLLHRFLFTKGISASTRNRIQLNAKHTQQENQFVVPEHDVELLQLVSEPLRIELHFEIHAPTIMMHPLLGRYAADAPLVMRKLCHVAVSTISYSKGDMLFSSGEVAQSPKMLFCTQGELSYHISPMYDGNDSIAPLIDWTASMSSIGSIEVSSHRVFVGEWICEACLWTTWMHCGLLRAATNCRILALDSTIFQEEVCKAKSGFSLFPYASQFVNSLNEDPDLRSDLYCTLKQSELLVADAYEAEPGPVGRGSRASQLSGTSRQSVRHHKKSILEIKNGLASWNLGGKLSTKPIQVVPVVPATPETEVVVSEMDGSIA